MTRELWYDPSEWLRVRVRSESGVNIGRITAVIHHRTGCDVLVDHRRWLRRSVRRMDCTELVRIDQRTCCHSPSRLRAISGSDDWSVA